MTKAVLLAVMLALVPSRARAGASSIAISTPTFVEVTGGNIHAEIVPTTARNFFSVATHDGLTAASSSGENDMLLLVNPATSTVAATLLTRIMSTPDTAVSFTFWANTDCVFTSSGTQLNIARLRSDADAPTLKAYSLPTTVNHGALYSVMANGSNSPPIILNEEGRVRILPGHNILFTAKPSASNRTALYTIRWEEDTYP